MLTQTFLEIEKIITETVDFKTIVFKTGHGIQYQPGQFLTFIHNTGFGEIRRSYSIVAAPALGEPLAIGVKRVANGIFSRKLADEAKPGDVLLTTGAGGFFTLPTGMTTYNTIVLMAAGGGITPIYSLLKTVLHVHARVRVILIYSNREPGTAVYLNNLIALQQKFPTRFFMELLYSNNPDLLRAHLNHDLLISILRDYQITPSGSLFYTCGPETYMRMIMYVLHLQGIPRNHIRREDFIQVKKTAARAKPPDTDMHRVTIHYFDQIYHIPVQYPDTMLQAAKKHKINLPYSCETGKCGNCAALCIRGKIWHSDNEVLTEQELDKGIILTCTGYPIGGDVTIQFGAPNG